MGFGSIEMFGDVRVWDADSGEMTYSSGLHQIMYGGASDDIGLGIELHWSVKNSDRGWYRHRDFKTDLAKGIIEIMPFVDKADDIGNKIYKNDLIRETFEDATFILYEVKWNDEWCAWALWCNGMFARIDKIFAHENSTCVVVGNTCGKIQRQKTMHEHFNELASKRMSEMFNERFAKDKISGDE